MPSKRAATRRGDPLTGRAFRKLLGSGASLLALVLASAGGAAAQDAGSLTPQPLPAEAAPAATRINPTGRVLELDVQIRDGDFQLGAISIRIEPDDSISMPVERLIEVVGPMLASGVDETLRSSADADGRITLDQVNAAGLNMEYDPGSIELVIKVRADDRPANSIQLSRRDINRPGEPLPTENFSAYLNYAVSADYVHRSLSEDTGIQSPTADFFAAVNLFGLVFETEAIYDEDNPNAFERQASRVVWDWESEAIRFSAGDIRVPNRRYLGAEDILGLSVERLYSQIQPQRIIRPLGSTSFALDRTSTVEVLVNGSVVRAVRLQPGNYDFSDFPFAIGGNDVQIVVEDDAGRREIADFSYFLDQQLLDPGIVEFSLNYGISSELVLGERYYDEDRWVFTGFARVGVFDFLTAGVSGQADPTGQVIGGELLFTSGLGTMALDAAFSDIEAIGTGWAGRFVYERDFTSSLPDDIRVRLSAEYFTENFANLGDLIINQPLDLRLAGTVSYRVTRDVSLAFGGNYDTYRTAQEDSWSATANVSWQIDDAMNLQAGALAENQNGEMEYGFNVRFSMRLGPREFADASYDSRFERAELGYSRSAAAFADTWSADARLTYTPNDVTGNASVGYYSTRGDFSLSHNTFYDQSFSEVADSRTSARAQGSVSIAGTKASFGPTIYDSFAIIDTHESLGEADVYIDARRGEYSTRSDEFGPAVATLGSYSDRDVAYTVPDAPPGYDLGEGGFRVRPSYRSGYDLTVGSDFSVMAIGTLVDSSGNPIELLPGKATYLGEGEGAGRTVDIFTNRGGRFVASGVRPGRWRITIGEGSTARSVEIEIPEGVQGIVRLEPQEAR